MKRKIALLLGILLTFQLCSCGVKEPEPAAEGENTIVEISRGEADGDVNKLAASAVAYTDSFKSADGTVDIEINLEDTQLYEGGFQTLQITPRPFTEEEVQRIKNVLFGDAVFYEHIFCREHTRAELEEQRAFWQALLEREDLDALHCVLGMDGELRNTIERFLEKYKIEAAPETIERTVCDFTFKPISYYYHDAEEEDWYSIMAASEVGGVPYIFSATNNTNNGVRIFSVSAWLSYETVSPLGIRAEVLKDELLCVDKPDQEQIDAIKEKAEKMIAELDIGQWQINLCECEEDIGLEWETRYNVKITAVPVVNGIPMLRQVQPYYLRGTEEAIQNCYYPDMELSFAPDGTLLNFTLNTPVDILEVSSEKSRMMSFAELVGGIKTQFSRISATEIYHGNRYADAVVNDIELGYAMMPVNAGESELIQLPGINGDQLVVNNTDFLLVPAVAVYGNYRTYQTRPEEESAFDYRQVSGEDALFAVLNAANGSMIAPVNSTMILDRAGS